MTLSERVEATAHIPPWPTVDQVGTLHPDPYVHDAVRTLGTTGGIVERWLRDGKPGRWQHQQTYELVTIVYRLWPAYLIAAHKVRLLLMLYPIAVSHNVWEGNAEAVPLDLTRLVEAEGMYSRSWGDPMRSYLLRVEDFMEWPR